MAWEDMLNHKCDIYHAVISTQDVGYGLENANALSYPEDADEENIDCHFHVKSGQRKITQTEPINEYSALTKISLPLETDIRINDKIISRETGFSYIAELPTKIRNHHWICNIHREDAAKEAI